MKKLLLFAMLLCSMIYSYAQSATQSLSGKVYDVNSNKPLPGATVMYGGKGASSDKDGKFSIEYNGPGELTISFVGYQTWRLKIKSAATDLSIGLASSGHHLDEVEITATSAQNKSILYQPISLTKLQATELKRGNGLFLDDAINSNVPGVTMQRRAVSSGQQFNIRGYGNGSRGTRGVSSNFDGQGYKVYLNGIPVTDAEGITTMDDIDFGSIGNVEVTKGPAGTLYGQAIAGVVNLKTIKPEKGKTSIGQDVIVGDYGLRRYTTHFDMGGEYSSLLVNYGHQESDGFMLHTASHKDFVNIAGDFQPNAKQSITTYFGYSNSYDQRGGELTLAQYAAKDYSGNPEYIKRDAHSNVVSFRVGFGHTFAFNSNISNTTMVFGTGFNSNASSAGGWTDKTAINYGLRSTFNTRFSAGKSIGLSGITGVETQRQNAETVGYTMVKNPLDTAGTWVYGNPYYWIPGASTSNFVTTTGNTSVFTEWTVSLPYDFSMTAGVGISNMKINLNDRFNPATATRPATYDTSYKNMVSPHVAINKVFSKQLSLYASYSRGYKAPVSSYFYITTPAVTSPATPATGRVNGVLKPEIGDQFEAGTKGSLPGDRLTYQLAFFDAIFSNKMTAVAVVSPANPGTTLYSYMVNGGRQNDKGIEALVKYTAYHSSAGFFKTISPFGNITYSDFRYEDFRIQKSVVLTEDYSNQPVAGVSKIVATVGVDVATRPGIYANVNYFYKDRMPITSDGLTYTTSYSLLNAKLGFQHGISKHFDINAYAGVENITGTQYAYMVFVNQLPDAYMAAPYKANEYGGVAVKYNF